MRVVAQKYEYVCLESGDRWELYDTVGQLVAYTAFRDREPNYLQALLEKWGFEPAGFDVGGYGELIPDWEALGYPSEAACLAESIRRKRERLLREARSQAEALAGGLQ